MTVSAVWRDLTAQAFYISTIARIMTGCCCDVMQNTASAKAIPAVTVVQGSTASVYQCYNLHPRIQQAGTILGLHSSLTVGSEHGKRYFSMYKDNSMQSVVQAFLFIKGRVQKINPSLAGNNYLQIWRSIMKSLSKIFTLFKLKLLFSALLVVYLNCVTTHWILVAENKVDKLKGQ